MTKQDHKKLDTLAEKLNRIAYNQEDESRGDLLRALTIIERVLSQKDPA
jgi:hypothetical protein